MGYAFISYSSKNLEDALAMRGVLMNKGIKVWMAPGDIPAGSTYAGVIARAIKGSECLVLLLTEDSQNSKWVDKEVERAFSYSKTVIPVALDKLTLNDNFEFYLGNQQIVPVKQIRGDNKDLLKIVDQIGKLTGRESDAKVGESKITDVTDEYNNQRILIYSRAARKFGSARLDLEQKPICCSTDNQKAWEIFTVTVDDEGWASFKAYNNRYLSVCLNVSKELPPLRATAPKSLLWEKFKLYRTGNGYAIMARCNGKWVTSRIDWENNPLLASRTIADAWEMFDIKIV